MKFNCYLTGYECKAAGPPAARGAGRIYSENTASDPSAKELREPDKRLRGYYNLRTILHDFLNRKDNIQCFPFFPYK